MEFEQELIERTQAYFYLKFDREISPESADEYLCQFAELFSSMAVFAGTGAPPALPGAAAD